MKKVFAFFLGLFLALTCFPSEVVAESLDVGKSTNNIMLLAKKVEVLLGNNVSTRIMETAIADITTLDQHNIPQGYLVDISKNERNRLTYTYAFTDQILSKISVQRNENGLFLEINEGDLNNEVFIDSSNTIYLNGNQIIVKNSIIESNQSIQLVRKYYVNECPYGSPADYSAYIRTEQVADIYMNDYYINLTYSGFSIIMSVVLPLFISVPVATVILILSAFQTSNPYSDVASYRSYIYEHEDGYWVTETLAVLKYSTYLYPETNYQGTSEHVYSYFCNELEY